MSWENYDDVLQQLRAHGLLVDDLAIDTPRPQRCMVDGRRDREKRGWYWLTTAYLPRADGSGDAAFLVGSYGIWEGADNGKVKVAITKAQASLTEEQRKAIAARHKDNARRAEAMRKAEAEKAALRARQVWRAYVPTGQSAYLERKGVQPHGVRFDPKGAGTIAIPMQDVLGRVHGLQIIRGPDRGRKLEKEYWPKGHIKRGHFFMLGMPGGVILLAEGFATAATLAEATGLCVVVAFDANNLMPVAEALAEKYRRSRILICADDDYLQKCKACGQRTEVAEAVCSHCGEAHGQNNPGQVAAATAALAVSGSWVAPTFPGNREGAKLTDFNDLFHFPGGGLPAVRDQVMAAIVSAGWEAAATPAARESTPGEGGRYGRAPAQSIMEIEELVARFVPLDDGTGKLVFDTRTSKIVSREQMVALLPPKARWDDIKSDPVWKSRGAYYLDQVGFDPTGRDKDVLLNTWKGWPLEPAAGTCEKLLDLIDHLCVGEQNSPEMFDWLLDWMAYPLQKPGAKMATAVIMHGPQGTGKSAVFQTLAKIYGDYATVLNQRGLEDRFNADWVDSKLFLLAEEIVSRQEMWHIKNELKELVTGEWVRVNPKNIGAYRQRNHINIAYLSNEGQPLPIEPDDRRHAVIWTPMPLKQDFYDELFKELENGGVQAFYDFLLSRDLSHFHAARRPPMTDAKRDLIQISKPSEERFLDEWRAGELTHPFGPALGMDLYAAYLSWCRSNGVRHPRESNQFLGKVGKMDGWSNRPRWVYVDTYYTGSAIKKRVVVPSDADLEAAGVAMPSGDKTASQWLTDGYIEFQRTMGND